MLRRILILIRNTNFTRVFPVPFLLICISCATPFPVAELEEGMTAEEARQAFGEPRNIRDDNAWVYTDEDQNWMMFNPFFIEFGLIAGSIFALLDDDDSVEWDEFFVSRQDVYLHFEEEKLARWQVGEMGPHGIEESIVAIKVFKPRLLFGSETPSAIYFVRLDADGGYRQERVFVSNSRGDGYAYLVNADPGRYAAIGARIDHSSSSPGGYQTDIYTGKHTWVESYGSEYSGSSYWLFPESMINETIVTVEPSGVAFMGEFESSGDLGFDGADDTQTHYSEVFTGSAPENAVTKFFHKLEATYLAEYQGGQSEMATQRFLESSRAFAEVGWRALAPQETAEDRENNEGPEWSDPQNLDE